MKATQSGLVAYVRSLAKTYHGYYTWKIGDQAVRSYYLSVARAEWELYGALYRVMRRKINGC
jgi:hypothetical protein